MEHPTPEATRTAMVASLVSIFVLLFSMPAFVLGVWTIAIADVVFAALYFVPVLIARQLGRPFLAANVLCGIGCVHVGLAVATTNGLSGLSVLTALLVPVAATLTMGPRLGWTWLGVTLSMLATVHVLDLRSWFATVEISEEAHGWTALAVLATTGGLVQASVAEFAQERLDAQVELDRTLRSLEERVAARTAELEIEAAQRRSAELRAAQANQAKTSFLVNMSHELRTPLNAIQGYAELVGEELTDVETVPEHLERDLDQISSASAHLLGLIDNILEFARVEAGQLEINPASIDVAALLDECARLMKPVVESRQNRLEVLADESCTMWADPGRVRQIVLNLLSNANKFTDGGLVRVTCGNDPGAWIEVQDDGPGIEPALLPRLFERFTRGSDVHVPGTGLGLAIAHDLAERMGGTLTVRSAKGQGSTFRLEFPHREDQPA